MSGFDMVNVTLTCPSCQRDVTGFQSYDGPGHYESMPLAGVRWMWAPCTCGAWVEAEQTSPNVFTVRAYVDPEGDQLTAVGVSAR